MDFEYANLVYIVTFYKVLYWFMKRLSRVISFRPSGMAANTRSAAIYSALTLAGTSLI